MNAAGCRAAWLAVGTAGLLATASALPAQQQPASGAAAESPIARLDVEDGPRLTITAGDTVRIRARALDSAGRPVAAARLRYFIGGGHFEGTVDSTGLVRSGSTGTLRVAVVASVPGSRPVLEQVEVRMVAGPPAEIALTPEAARLLVGQRIRLAAEVRSGAGDRRADRATWRSSNPAVARVTEAGLVTAAAPGRAVISATAGSARRDAVVEVLAAQAATVVLTPERHHARTGDVVRLTAVARDARGRELAGVRPAWSLAPGHGLVEDDGTFVGYEPGDYVVTASFGARSADAVITLTPRDVRRPAEIVGRLPRTRLKTEELWLHPGGRYAYLGTGAGGDVMYAIDVSDPSRPVVTDSVVANTRRVNDIMTTPDGRFLVFTRAGAADRRNGIVICSLEDPAHPRPIAEFTEGVTAGVHSSFVYRDPRHGTHVFLTNDGTGALHIVNLDDPYHPREVAQWRTERPDAGRSLHDVDVQDGLAYLSYWNDGLVILDVGNGIRGGSPANPQLVAQHKYDLNELYREVEAVGGPGFIRGTHTAWRHGRYVFVADEVFPGAPVKGAKDAAAGRAYGRLQVLDVSDLDRIRSVAWYEPEYGGVHNVWVAGDTLYMGTYEGGFRAFDVSGELRGDLRAQRREMVHVHTADMDGHVPNASRVWGVVVRDGLAYVNDTNNGLWIIRMQPPKDPPIP